MEAVPFYRNTVYKEYNFVTLCKTGRYGANVDEFCSGVSCLCEETEIVPFVRGNTKIIFD